MPSLKLPDKSVPGWLTAIPIAHRGLHNSDADIAENSLSAFSAAILAGLSIEFDVHLSKDQQPIVFHDSNLTRMTGYTGRICDLTAAELEKLQLADSADYIPHLQTVLAHVDGKVPLVIELKQSSIGNNALFEAVWTVLKSYSGPYCLQSFDPFLLQLARRQAPHVIRGQLGTYNPPPSIPMAKRMMVRHLLLNRLSKPHYIGYNVKDINRPSLRRVLRGHLPLLAWTVNDTESLGKARNFADNIIFENLPLPLVKSSFDVTG